MVRWYQYNCGNGGLQYCPMDFNRTPAVHKTNPQCTHRTQRGAPHKTPRENLSAGWLRIDADLEEDNRRYTYKNGVLDVEASKSKINEDIKVLVEIDSGFESISGTDSDANSEPDLINDVSWLAYHPRY